MKRASRSAFLDHVRDPSNRFYLGCAGAEAVGTTQLLMDGSCAGIYGVSTVRAHRGKGVATALLLRAIADARAAGCDIIFLRTAALSEARRLYERLGFEEGFTTETWAARL